MVLIFRPSDSRSVLSLTLCLCGINTFTPNFLQPLQLSSAAHTRTHALPRQLTGLGVGVVLGVRVGCGGGGGGRGGGALPVHDPCCSLRRGRYGFVLFWKGPVVWAALLVSLKWFSCLFWLFFFFALVAIIWTKGQLASDVNIAHTTTKHVYISLNVSVHGFVQT